MQLWILQIEWIIFKYIIHLVIEYLVPKCVTFTRLVHTVSELADSVYDSGT